MCCASTRSWRGCGSRGRTLSISALCACSASNRSAFPFLDTHAVLAAAECGRQGDRGLSVQPLRRARASARLFAAVAGDHARCSWVSARPGGWARASTCCSFCHWLSCCVHAPPKELLILGSAAISPMTVYALERANNDLAIFLLVICGAILFTLPRPYRLFSYGLFVTAGLLKYYPLALLVLAAREGRRDGLVIAAATILALILFAVAFYPELSMAVAGIPRRSVLLHRRLLRPQPAVRFRRSPGRRYLPHSDRGVAAGRAVGAGRRANASHGSTARARATRLDGERDAIPRHRRAVGRGLLLCRPERKLSRHFSSPGAVRAGLPPSIGQRPRSAALLRPDDRGGALRHVGGVLPPRPPRHCLPGSRRRAELARRGVLLDRPGAGVVVAGCRARRARFVLPAAIALRGDFRKSRRRSGAFPRLSV